VVKLNDKQAQAITNLRGNSNFRVFVEMLNTMIGEELHKGLSYTELLHVGRGQGRGVLLTELVEAIETAPDTLQRLKPQ